ncbi:hypothetical protein [Pseudomonas phage PhL_UNISO_PA-DSM_ph0031]|nr:hypothetical protein [Pseudomonas phage PhL_UNISO_PA-DSM_ph0031]
MPYAADSLQGSPERPSNLPEPLAFWKAADVESANGLDTQKRPQFLTVRRPGKPPLPTILGRGRELGNANLADRSASDETALGSTGSDAASSRALNLHRRQRKEVGRQKIQTCLQSFAIENSVWRISIRNEFARDVEIKLQAHSRIGLWVSKLRKQRAKLLFVENYHTETLG